MKLFFRAKNEKGEEISGEREATDRFALARDLRTEGLTVIYAEPAGKRKKPRSGRLTFLGGLK